MAGGGGGAGWGGVWGSVRSRVALGAAARVAQRVACGAGRRAACPGRTLRREEAPARGAAGTGAGHGRPRRCVCTVMCIYPRCLFSYQVSNGILRVCACVRGCLLVVCQRLGLRTTLAQASGFTRRGPLSSSPAGSSSRRRERAAPAKCSDQIKSRVRSYSQSTQNRSAS